MKQNFVFSALAFLSMQSFATELENSHRAGLSINRARFALAESLSATVLDPKLRCTEQFAVAEIQGIVNSNLLMNSLLYARRLGQLPMTANVDDLMKSYPATSKVLENNLVYRAAKVALFSQMSEKTFEMIPAVLEGVTVFQQKTPRPKEKQPSFTFLKDGVVVARDSSGHETKGTWSLQKSKARYVSADIIIDIDNTRKVLGLFEGLSLPYFLGISRPQVALASYTVVEKEPVEDRDDIYSSIEYQCLVYAH